MLPRHGVTPALIYEARRRIAGQAVRSPLIQSTALSARFAACDQADIIATAIAGFALSRLAGD